MSERMRVLQPGGPLSRHFVFPEASAVRGLLPGSTPYGERIAICTLYYGLRHMWEGLFHDHFLNDPIFWYDIHTASSAPQIHAAYHRANYRNGHRTKVPASPVRSSHE